MSNRLGQAFGALLIEAGTRIAGRIATRLDERARPTVPTLNKVKLLSKMDALEEALAVQTCETAGDIRQRCFGMLQTVRELRDQILAGGFDV